MREDAIEKDAQAAVTNLIKVRISIDCQGIELPQTLEHLLVTSEEEGENHCWEEYRQ